MSDFVCYEVFVDGKNTPLYCVGTSEKDILDSVYEWSIVVDSMKLLGEGYVARDAAKEANL